MNNALAFEADGAGSESLGEYQLWDAVNFVVFISRFRIAVLCPAFICFGLLIGMERLDSLLCRLEKVTILLEAAVVNNMYRTSPIKISSGK